MTVLFFNDTGIPDKVLDNVVSLELDKNVGTVKTYKVRYVDFDRSGREYLNTKYVETHNIQVLPKVEAKIGSELLMKGNENG